LVPLAQFPDIQLGGAPPYDDVYDDDGSFSPQLLRVQHRWVISISVSLFLALNNKLPLYYKI
jgi:hypothetical protein